MFIQCADMSPNILSKHFSFLEAAPSFHALLIKGCVCDLLFDQTLFLQNLKVKIIRKLDQALYIRSTVVRAPVLYSQYIYVIINIENRRYFGNGSKEIAISHLAGDLLTCISCQLLSFAFLDRFLLCNKSPRTWSFTRLPHASPKGEFELQVTTYQMGPKPTHPPINTHPLWIGRR